MNTKSQTKSEAIEMIVSVLVDGSRIDRILRRADDGHLYTDRDLTFLSDCGRYTPPYVDIPLVDCDTNEFEDQELAEQLIRELDEQVSES